MTSATTPALKNPPRRAGRRVQRSLGGNGAAPDTERVGDFLLRETEVVVRDDHRPLTTCQETEQLAGLESVQQLVGLRWDRRLAKGADELVKPERKPETAEPPRSPERDPEQPARECVIAFRRTPHPFRE